MSTVVPGSGKTIDVKRAVQLAREALYSLFEGEIQDIPRLEEVELSEDDRFWLITMSFTRKAQDDEVINHGVLAGMIPKSTRTYKRIVLSADDGSVKSVSIRTVNE